MKVLVIVISSVILGGLVMLASHKEVQFFIPQIGFLVASYFLIRNRYSIASWFLKFPVSNSIALFLLSSLPFMIFEESINCLPPEMGGCALLPITLPFLLITLVILLFVIRKFKLKRFWVIITVFSVLGVIWEITVGVSGAAFLALPPIWFAIISLWVWLSYTFIAIIPLTLEFQRMKSPTKG